MSAPQPCDRTEPHPPHFHRWNSVVTSCPGRDPEQGHAGDRDRPAGNEFDWTPEHLHIGDLAAVIVRLHSTESPAYSNAMVLWETLTGMDEPASLTYAYSIATLLPPVLAAPIPF